MNKTASELSRTSVFINETVKNANLKKELKNAKKSNEKEPGLKSAKTSKPVVNKSRKSVSQKDNPVQKKPETIKSPRGSRKADREPLKALNVTVKPPVKGGVSSSTKTKTIAPLTRAKPNQNKEIKIPKIKVYADTPTKSTAQEKLSRNKCIHRLSKSLDSLGARGRRSFPEGNKTPKLTIKESKKTRNSLNDAIKVKSVNKKTVKNIPGEKNLVKTKPQLPKFRPGHPEYDEIFSKLETMFPNIDPDFMKSQLAKFRGSLLETIECLILKEKAGEFPTRDDYVRRLETEKLEKKVMESFSAGNFLKMIPDPWDHFLKTEKQNCVRYTAHSLHYLKNKYKQHYLKAIQDALSKNDYSLYLANKELKKKNPLLKMRINNRSKSECDFGKPTTFDIQFVHEVMFIENENKIKSYLKKAESTRHKKFQKAEEKGSLMECILCTDYNLLQEDVITCPAKHVFCKDCIVKYVQIEMIKDDFQFKCLGKCKEKFPLETLQAVLSPLVMAKIIERNYPEERESAGMKDLVCCPVCSYVTIMSSDTNVLKCLNPSCLFESCRQCKQSNHTPLECPKLEEFDKTILEVEIVMEEQEQQKQQRELSKKENKQLSNTDSPIICMYCGGNFLIGEDSTQMVCLCGATMCSVCWQPYSECEHFYVETSKRLSSSSDEVVSNTMEGNTTLDDIEESSGCSETLPHLLPSESNAF